MMKNTYFVPIQYNEQDDYDHFSTKNVVIDKFNLDNISVREALKRVMNLLLLREKCYLGELAVAAGYSIEKTEILIDHLVNIGRVKKVITNVSMVELNKIGS